MRKGFTLLELLIVVIIFGVLAAVAVPQYTKAVERAKCAKAKNALGLIATAQKMYRAENDSFTLVSDAATAALLDPYTELDSVQGDNDWDYTVTAGGVGIESDFIAIATRPATVHADYAGTTITLADDGTCLGTHILRGPDCK